MKTIEVLFPYTGEKIGEVSASSIADVARAIESARSAFHKTARHLTSYERSEILLAVSTLLKKNRQDLADLITLESGKVIRESLIEVDRAVTTMIYAAEEARRIHGEIFPCDISPRKTGKMAYVHREPLGVIGAITPFNFPLNTVVHKVAPAIAAGNTVVLKPSPKTPLTAERLTGFFKDAGAPDGLMNMVQGGSDVGEALAGHRDVRLLTFTGSVAVGHRLTQLGGIKKLVLELGGNDPLIIFPDGDLDAAVSVAIEQGLGTAGQRCTAVKRVLVHESIVEKITDRLIPRVKALKIGDPREQTTDIGPMIDEAAAIEIEDRVNDAVQKGARLLVGGKREGAIHPPIVLDNISAGCKIITEETFGPVLPILPFRDLGDCIYQANSTIYGLQAGVFTNDLGIIKKLRQELDVGTLIVNDGPGFRIDSLPFGGVKESGLGREGVVASIREMTVEKGLIL